MNPDDMPSPEEERLMSATMPQDSATVLRLVSAMAEGDRDAVAMLAYGRPVVTRVELDTE